MNRWLISGAVLTAVVLVVLLCLYNPQTSVWFPKCAFWLLTGFECPGCGSQRAIYQLLHGNLVSVVHYNAFMVISVPYAVMLVACSVAHKSRLANLRRFCTSSATVFCFVALVILWWIVRNIWFKL